MFPKYGPLSASARCRYYAYEPYLRSDGIEVSYYPLFSDAYLQNYFSTGRKEFSKVLQGFWGRAKQIVQARDSDCLVIHTETLPWIPAVFEKALLTDNTPFILDYDDALFHQYDQHSNSLIRGFLGSKISRLMRHSSGVIAGNDYIAEFAANAGARRVTIVPTVVDLRRYETTSVQQSKVHLPVIGWIGSRSTAYYLESLIPTLSRLAQDHPFQLLVIGDGDLLAGREMEVSFPINRKSWSESTEIADLNTMDIGIMPLPDTPWERGKCGYKLIQYMGVGNPVVASPVGVNRKIVEPGINGFLAGTEDEWVEALGTLIEDAALRTDLGRAGREKVEREYSLDVTAPKLIDLLQEVAAGQ